MTPEGPAPQRTGRWAWAGNGSGGPERTSRASLPATPRYEGSMRSTWARTLSRNIEGEPT